MRRLGKQTIGLIFIIAGAVFILCNLPPYVWLILLGVALVALGVKCSK